MSVQPTSTGHIQEQNPLLRIYTGRRGAEPKYTAVAEKTTGCSLGAFYKKAHHDPANHTLCSRWLGRVGEPRGLLRNDFSSSITHAEKEIAIDAILNKVAFDLYKELGRGIFIVPKTRLSLQPVLNDFTREHALADHWHAQGIHTTLQTMSRIEDGYNDFEKARTLDETGQEIGFMKFIEKYHRPPDNIAGPDGKPVPLRGLMELLAVGRLLADTDVIGGSGQSAGFILKDGIACTVKTDPGFAFQFTQESDAPGFNWVINSYKVLGGIMLNDIKDLQIANCNPDVTVKWNSLTNDQKDEFLSSLFNCCLYQKSDEWLHFFFYRDGHFTRSELEQIPVEVAQTMVAEMTIWMSLQLKIYRNELIAFRNKSLGG